MKALILNSGIGNRMDGYTHNFPKCMVPLAGEGTIIERQLEILEKTGIQEAIVTTGFLAEKLESYVNTLGISMKIIFVNNDKYDKTNYIYSIYMARDYLKDDIILLHGDLVFEQSILEEMLNFGQSCMAVSSVYKIPEKDFKAVIKEGKIVKIGIEFFEGVVAAQPLYVLKQKLWLEWLTKIGEFCQNGISDCYAENALNQILEDHFLYPYDFGNRLCQEIDRGEDLLEVRKAMEL